MNVVPVRRYDYRRRQRNILLGCGCLTIGAFGSVVGCALLYAFGALTAIIFQLAGVEQVGKTDDLFDANTVPSVVQVQNPSVPDQVVIDFGGYGDETLDTRDYTIVVGSAADNGAPVVTASFTEPGLLNLCYQRSTVCSGSDNRYRNPAIDLHPGGAVVYADVDAGVFWQRVGVVLMLNNTFNSFYVVGVDIDGTTYNPATLPSILPADVRDAITQSISDIESTGNDILRQLALDTGGQTYTLSQVIIDETTLTLVMR